MFPNWQAWGANVPTANPQVPYVQNLNAYQQQQVYWQNYYQQNPQAQQWAAAPGGVMPNTQAVATAVNPPLPQTPAPGPPLPAEPSINPAPPVEPPSEEKPPLPPDPPPEEKAEVNIGTVKTHHCRQAQEHAAYS